MALEKQVIDIPLEPSYYDKNTATQITGGLDTKTDPKLVKPGSFLTIENGIYTEAKKIKKRNGYSSLGNSVLGSTTPISSGKRLGVFNNGSINNELLLFSNNAMYSYNTSGNNWVNKGELVGATVSEQTIFRNNYQQTQVDMDTNQGVTVYAWKDSRGGVRCSVYDENENTVILNDALVNVNGEKPKVLGTGSNIFIYMIDSNVNIKFVTIAVGNPATISSLSTVVTDVHADKLYDVTLSGQNMVLVYKETGPNFKHLYIGPSGIVSPATLPAPLVMGAHVLENCLSIYVDPATLNIFVAYHTTAGGGGVRIHARTPNFAALINPTNLDTDIANNYINITMCKSGNAFNDIVVFYEMNATNSYDHLIKKNTISLYPPEFPGTIGTSTIILRSAGLASKAFVVNGKAFFHSVFSTTLQPTYFTVSEAGIVFSRIIPGQAGGLTDGSILPKVTNVATNQYVFPNSVVTKIVTQNNTNYTLKGVNRTLLNFGQDNLFQSLQSGLALHIIGGMLWNYDGSTLAEHSFHMFPENVTGVQGGSGSMADGTYLYNIVYAWTSAKGEIHRSFPFSLTKVVTAGGGTAKITLTIPTLRITGKTNVIIEVYRTQAAGIIPYKLTSVASPLFNDPTVDSVNYVDTVADASITSSEILYTVGGLLGNICPPSCTFGVIHQNRIILKTENLNQCWYSKLQQQGYGLGFTDFFTFQIDPEGQDITNLASLDANIIFLKRFKLRAIAGNGPNDTGTNSDFSLDQKINSDAGCSEIRGIVSTDTGIIYKSDKGIYRLNRSLTVDYLGWPVEAYNSQTITSSLLVPNTNQVRFTTRLGPCLTYDYLYNKWTTFTNHSGEDAVIWNNKYVYLKSDGTVLVETPGSFLDISKQIVLKLGLPWVNLSNVQGFQRIYSCMFLGNFKSNHKLNVGIYYDYQDNPVYTTTWQPNNVINTNTYGTESPYGALSPFGGQADNINQFMIHNPVQKCQSIRYEFSDIPDSSTNGESYSLSSLNLYVGVKKGLNKVRAAKQIG